MCNTTGTRPEISRCALENHEKTSDLGFVTDTHTHPHTILNPCLRDLINHLIFSANFIGWEACGTVIVENKFGLYFVGFGKNQ